MPLYEVVLQQNYQGQQIINRWNYLMTGVPASVTGSFALISVLGGIYNAAATPPAYPPTGLMRILSNAQSNLVTFDLLGAKNLYSVTDFYESPFVQPLTGAQTGSDAGAPFLAYGYRTNRVRTDVRRATKRFVGTMEAQVGVGGAILPSFITSHLTPLAVAMSATLTFDDDGNTLTFSPVVCGKLAYNPDVSRPDHWAYRYYATEQEQMLHTAQGIVWDVYPDLRSQVSRQRGRGR